MGLVEWFAKRKEKSIRDGIHNMLSLIKQCDTAFRAQYTGWTKGEKISHEPVHVPEHEADIIRRRLIDEIEESALPPERKEAFIRLVRQVDKIADWTLAAARALSLVAAVQEASGLPPEFHDKIMDLLKCNTKNIDSIARATEDLLKGDIESALAGADESERLEESADTKRDMLKGMIFAEKLKVSPFVGVGILEMIESIENVADACEDLGDEIRAICSALEK